MAIIPLESMRMCLTFLTGGEYWYLDILAALKVRRFLNLTI
ncbi:MAG: hypothetical protein ACK4XH_09535 [Microcystis sp.]|nr:hypothetical protein [Microcystis sp. M045S1]